jgi:RNA polymerase sigma-70 factor (ECF subfamily)
VSVCDDPHGAAAAALAGDDAAFASLVEPHRRELQVHCYRMLGSYVDAEDHVQKTLLRAWRSRSTYAGRSSLRAERHHRRRPVRAWRYRIATNACLDTLRRDDSRVVPVGAVGEPDAAAPAEVPWLQPFPDRLLDEVAPSAEQPDAVVVAKETVELAFLAAIQVLSPYQRAVLILRDVLGWSAAETADLLDTSVATVTSALQRGRASLRRQLPQDSSAWTPTTAPDDQERALLERYLDAHHRSDIAALVRLLRHDVRFSMPPQPGLVVGRDVLAGYFAEAFDVRVTGDFRLVPTRANRQPAAANYVRAPGDIEFRALALDVLRVEGGAIAEITAFEPHLFAAFGLPLVLRDADH